MATESPESTLANDVSPEIAPASETADAKVSRPQLVIAVLGALSVSHLLNDVMQSLLPAVYPLLKENYSLSFFQVGLITFTFQVTASLLQPLVGMATDRRPWPYSLVVGMGFTLVGLNMLAMAGSFESILIAAAMVGIGSSVFHPEASRVARLASGGRYGFAQSLFQVGGNAGSAIGPLLAAFVVAPWGQPSIAWFSIGAIAALMILGYVGRWYHRHLNDLKANPRKVGLEQTSTLAPGRVYGAVGVLLMLVFSKYIYLVSLSSYYTFYLMDKFDVPVQSAQLYLFVFLGAVAVGTLGGGPVGDRLGFKTVIWFSILGVLPFTLILPYANLFWTAVLTVPIGLILASAFSAIIVYAQELMPSKVGMIAGMFFGFAFGIAGIGAAALGWLADQTSIEYVYHVCSFLPLVGLLTAFLPNLEVRD
ncbi:MFS transporter [Blastopirellula marina]|uniref:Major facilitator superfamily (MFS_1) transporter n=1 Tax=Blastopirellula marina DSM 3645 TaxID=314230 RepID=A3ZNM2_9BACT|nr:MFS transporter [Blastopirellula marina]EAQ81917.1 Major facilitator superfamily (MFS_1) transporter [Blastopirellula marina DSM 3645]